MNNYTMKEIGNICQRCLTKNNRDIHNFVEVFNYYKQKNNSKKLEALANIFNQCFLVEQKWEYDYSTDESKFVGYNISSRNSPELILKTLENQYNKINKLKFEEENKNKELQESINELEN